FEAFSPVTWTVIDAGRAMALPELFGTRKRSQPLGPPTAPAALLTSKAKTGVPEKATPAAPEPLTVRVPGLLPGAITVPLLMTRLLTDPPPPIVAPALASVTTPAAVPAWLFASTMPALTVRPPEKPLPAGAARFRTPAPPLVRALAPATPPKRL